ncbi:MAG: VPDSG-CTERM exosortase interaction domain protein [Paludibacteraceae bacterium]|nr:VPDSG-CTERM exosortase interaction domain protein [Paludibacteraceae bacterium]
MKIFISQISKVILALTFTLIPFFVVQAQVSFFEKPVKYEGKRKTSFKVFQTLENGALAYEVSDPWYKLYYGNVVYLIGDKFYDGMIIKVKKPFQDGVYRYITNNGIIKTVPAFIVKFN